MGEALHQLADEPRPRQCKKLINMPGWRVRLGDCRVLCTIDDKRQLATVYKFSPHRSAYRGNWDACEVKGHACCLRYCPV